VGAGNGNALLEAHQFGQHQRARHHRNAPLARGQHFGVVGLHGGGRDHGIGTHQRGCRMAHMVCGYPAPARRLQRGAVGQVRAGDGVAQVEQHLGNARHAGAADADEVDVAMACFMRKFLAGGTTMIAVAWFFAVFLAASPHCNSS
jgi:hypothetical protein